MQESHIYIHLIIQHASQKYHDLKPCHDSSACEYVATDFCGICGKPLCERHCYRYDYLQMWGDLWEGTGYPPAISMCETCIDMTTETKQFYIKLRKKEGDEDKAAYEIVKSHLETMPHHKLEMLISNEEYFNAKVDHFFEGVFSRTSLSRHSLRRLMAEVLRDLLNRKDTDKHERI